MSMAGATSKQPCKGAAVSAMISPKRSTPLERRTMTRSPTANCGFGQGKLR